MHLAAEIGALPTVCVPSSSSLGLSLRRLLLPLMKSIKLASNGSCNRCHQGDLRLQTGAICPYLQKFSRVSPLNLQFCVDTVDDRVE